MESRATKKLLILDLDETLIHATETKLEREPDFTVGQYFVYRRPFLAEFLRFCFVNFTVAVWTTGTKNYAESIVENIFAEGMTPAFLWSRERCTIGYDAETREYGYSKKMAKVRRRAISRASVSGAATA